MVALARSSEDIPAIRQGIAKRVKDINAVQAETLMDIMEQPDEIVTHVNHVWANVGRICGCCTYSTLWHCSLFF